MISSELAAILADYFRHAGEDPLPSDRSGCAVLANGRFRAAAASVPDARTAMLYAQAGRLQDDAASGEDAGAWIVLNRADATASDAGAPCGSMLYNGRTGAVALAASRPVDQLHGPAFQEWVNGFFRELSEIDEMIAECGDGQDPATAGFAHIGERTWLRI